MDSSKQNITVRPLKRHEFSLAAELERLTLEEAWSAEAIGETVAANGCYVGAFQGETFLGHGGFTFAADEGYITNIAVSPVARRKGVGTAIIEGLLRKATQQNLSFLSLEVRESNVAAIKLYEKCGFSVRGVRPKFYKNPIERAVIMTKDIEGNL